MAFRVYDDWSNEPKLAQNILKDGWFNVTHAVGGKEFGTGISAPNFVTDVQLLYCFLFIIYRGEDKSMFNANPSLDNSGLLPPNQKYHSPKVPKMMSVLIRLFQTDMKKRGKPIFIDGRCDRANGKISSISKTIYTIVLANFYYFYTINKKHGRDDWQDYFLADSLLPSEVKSELQMSSVQFQSLTFFIYYRGDFYE